LKEHAAKSVTLDTVATEFLKRYRLHKEKIKIRGRNNAQSEARKEFAFKANRQYQFPVCEIARYLEISSQSVSKMIRDSERVNSGLIS